MTHSLDDALVVEWARKTVAEARAGRFDLRDLGKAMTGKWDQDFPAAVLAYIARTALEAAGVAELRARISRLEAALGNHDDLPEQLLRDADEMEACGAGNEAANMRKLVSRLLQARAALTNQGKAQG